MKQSIHIDEIVNEIINGNKGHSQSSLVESFIDAIRPFELSDVQAVSLFKQVEQRMNKRLQRLHTRPVVTPDNWALLPC